MSEFRYYRPNNTPPVVMNLIIINALVFFAQMMFDSRFALTGRLALWPIFPGIETLFKPYQIFTHMFSHGGFSHILFNMFGLFMFGRVLENFWGPKKFLIFYLLCGIGAAACHLGVQYFRAEQVIQAFQNNQDLLINELDKLNSPAVGASGAIMGIFVAFAYLFPNTELYMMFVPIPVKAKWAVLIMAFIDLFGGVANLRGDNIAHFAHLGGAIVGFALVYYWNRSNRKTFY